MKTIQWISLAALLAAAPASAGEDIDERRELVVGHLGRVDPVAVEAHPVQRRVAVAGLAAQHGFPARDPDHALRGCRRRLLPQQRSGHEDRRQQAAHVHIIASQASARNQPTDEVSSGSGC